MALLAAGCTKVSDPQPPSVVTSTAAATAAVTSTVELGPVIVEADGWGSGRTFFGTPLREARSIVFISDRSGSMTDSIDFIKYELKRCVGQMGPETRFAVLFMSGGQPTEMPSRALVLPTEENRKRAFEFIDAIAATGETSPQGAIKRAFALEPDEIFLLTYGECDRAVVDLVKKLEASHKCPVHTFCFFYPTSEAILKEIAESTGGAYRFIGEGDLWDLFQPVVDENEWLDPDDP
jgi:hypothetical protein